MFEEVQNEATHSRCSKLAEYRGPNNCQRDFVKFLNLTIQQNAPTPMLAPKYYCIYTICIAPCFVLLELVSCGMFCAAGACIFRVTSAPMCTSARRLLAPIIPKGLHYRSTTELDL